MTDDLVFRLRERARIRRQIPDRKSVQNGEPDRIADLLDEAANAILHYQIRMGDLASDYTRLRKTAADACRTVKIVPDGPPCPTCGFRIRTAQQAPLVIEEGSQ